MFWSNILHSIHLRDHSLWCHSNVIFKLTENEDKKIFYLRSDVALSRVQLVQLRWSDRPCENVRELRLFNWQFPYQTVTFVTRISEYWPIHVHVLFRLSIHSSINISINVYYCIPGLKKLTWLDIYVHKSKERDEWLFLLDITVCYSLPFNYFSGHGISRFTG